MRGGFIAVCGVLTISFLMLSSGMSVGKGKDGGSTGPPVERGYYAGMVVDYDTMSPLGGMYLLCMPTFCGVGDYTWASGYYLIDPNFDASGLIVNYETNWDYWDQYLYENLPTTSTFLHFLPRCQVNAFSNFMHLTSTDYARFEYPAGYDRDIKNYGYDQSYYVAEYPVAKSDSYVGGWGQDFVHYTEFTTSGITYWVNDVNNRNLEIGPAWLMFCQSSYLDRYVDDSLSPTDPRVLQNLPFEDIWVDKGHSVYGSVIEGGSHTWDDGEMGSIWIGGNTANRQSVPARVEQRCDSSKELRWKIEVPDYDPQPGHWFRVYYDGSYSYTGSSNIHNIPTVNGLVSTHVWCVDSEHGPNPYTFYPPFPSSSVEPGSNWEEDSLLASLDVTVSPYEDTYTGDVGVGAIAAAGPFTYATCESYLGFEFTCSAQLETMTVESNWIASWDAFVSAKRGGDGLTGEANAEIFIELLVIDSASGQVISKESLSICDLYVIGAGLLTETEGSDGEDVPFTVGLSCDVHPGAEYRIVTRVYYHIDATGMMGGIGSATAEVCASCVRVYVI